MQPTKGKWGSPIKDGGISTGSTQINVAKMIKEGREQGIDLLL